MFRFEIHLRITDEAGRRVQSASGGPTDSSFLLSSLFDGSSSSSLDPLSDFCAEVGVGDPSSLFSAEEDLSSALLSSLCASSDDLCCELVDGFVSAKEDGLFIGGGKRPRHAWTNVGFPTCDWNFFGSASSASSADGDETACRGQKGQARSRSFKRDTSEEEEKSSGGGSSSTHWSSEEENQGALVEFDSALWESLSG